MTNYIRDTLLAMANVVLGRRTTYACIFSTLNTTVQSEVIHLNRHWTSALDVTDILFQKTFRYLNPELKDMKVESESVINSASYHKFMLPPIRASIVTAKQQWKLLQDYVFEWDKKYENRQDEFKKSIATLWKMYRLEHGLKFALWLLSILTILLVVYCTASITSSPLGVFITTFISASIVIAGAGAVSPALFEAWNETRLQSRFFKDMQVQQRDCSTRILRLIVTLHAILNEFDRMLEINDIAGPRNIQHHAATAVKYLHDELLTFKHATSDTAATKPSETEPTTVSITTPSVTTIATALTKRKTTMTTAMKELESELDMDDLAVVNELLRQDSATVQKTEKKQ